MIKLTIAGLRLDRGAVAAAALLLCASAAIADPPGAPGPAPAPAKEASVQSAPPGQDGAAYKSFDLFAGEWMQKMERAEAYGRSHPTVQAVAGQPVLSYKGYDDKDFRIELKPTGSAQAPYVGILHYRESLYRCADQAATQCTTAETTPVTEIFRFQDGRWVY